MKKETVSAPPKSRLRTGLFRAVYGCVLAVCLLVCLVVLWCLVEVKTAEKLRTFTGKSFVLEGDRYVSVNPMMTRQSFSAAKDGDTVRIFVVGTSVAMGWPYVENQASLLPGLLDVENRGGLAMWLGEYLSSALPDRRFEVINAARNTKPSFSESMAVIREIAAIGDPDLLVVLHGNNEGALTAVGRPESDVDVFSGTRQQFEACLAKTTSHYRASVGEFVRFVEERKLKTFLLTVPNNLKFPPLCSDPGERRRYEESDVHRLLKEKRFRQVIEAMEAEDTNHPSFLYALGLSYENSGDYDRALSCFIRARDNDYYFGRCRSDWNDIVRSIRSPFVDVIDIEGILYAGYRGKGIPGFDLFLDDCHLKIEGNKFIARETASRYIRRHSGQPDAVSRLATARVSEVDLRRLKRIYFMQKLKQFRLKIVTALYNRKYKKDIQFVGEVLDNYAGELKRVQRALDSKDVPEHDCLAFVSGGQGPTGGHRVPGGTAGEDNSQDAFVHLHLGLGLVELGKHEEAIARFREAARIRPQWAQAHYQWGKALCASGRLKEGLERYRKVLQIHPAYEDTFNQMAAAFLYLRKFDQAVAYCGKTLQIYPESFMAHTILGFAWLEEGKLEQAVGVLEKAVELEPGNGQARRLLDRARAEIRKRASPGVGSR